MRKAEWLHLTDEIEGWVMDLESNIAGNVVLDPSDITKLCSTMLRRVHELRVELWKQGRIDSAAAKVRSHHGM